MGIIDNVRETVGLIQKMDNLDLYRRILDLQAEVTALVDENRTLAERLRITDDLRFSDNCYWRTNASGETAGPYCPRCWDVDGHLVRLLTRHKHHPQCPECKTWAEATNFEE